MRFLLFILFFTIYSVDAQEIELRESITKGFDNAPVPNILLFNEIESKVQFDSIAIQSKYLDSLNLEKRIIGFKITGLSDTVIFTEKITGYVFPESIKEKIKNCNECKSIKVDQITIRWFTGTYGIRTSKTWKIKAE